MQAEISCHIVFVDAASAQTALTYLNAEGGMARRFAQRVVVSKPAEDGSVTLDYSVDLKSLTTRDLIIAQLKKYRTTLAAQVLAGSSGFLETHNCYHDEGKSCDRTSVKWFEWGVQES